MVKVYSIFSTVVKYELQNQIPDTCEKLYK